MNSGFKQTEIGVLPEEWEVKPIGETLKIKHGKSQKEVESKNGLYPILGTGGLMGYSNNFLYDKESVLIGRKGTIDKPRYMNTPFWSVDTLFYSEINDNYSAKYLYYNFLMIDWYRHNEASGVPSLNAKTIEKICIPMPPTKAEQTAIATALSDMDALITQTERLIQKKKDIKQGLMQELLSPKVGWEVKKFTDIVEYIHGKAHEQHIVDDGRYIVVNSKFISTNGNVIKYSNHSFLTAKVNDILTVLSDLPNGKALAKCFIVDKENTYAINQRICIWRSKGSHPKFLYYLLNRNKYFLQLDDGVTQTHILNGDINAFELEMLENIEEQTQIAQILTDADNEIQALETKLSKQHAQKQGMMQVLLTGKIRLVLSSP